jgi:hypothetical protein
MRVSNLESYSSACMLHGVSLSPALYLVSMMQAHCAVPVCAWCSAGNDEVVLLQLCIPAAHCRSHQLPQPLVEECPVHKHPVIQHDMVSYICQWHDIIHIYHAFTKVLNKTSSQCSRCLFNWVTIDSALILSWLQGISMSSTCLVENIKVVYPKIRSSRLQKNFSC